MKMPENQSTENGLYDYEETSYFSATLENNEIEEFNAPPENDFSEYLWMENEEEFDKEVLQRLEEEALMEQCIEAMLAENENEGSDSSIHQSNNASESNSDVANWINNLKLDGGEVAKGSNLNPLAAEFIPAVRTPVEAVSSSS